MIDVNEMPVQDKPPFPTCVVNVLPQAQGMIITFYLAAGLTLTQSIGAEAMDQIMAKWQETKQAEEKKNAPHVGKMRRSPVIPHDQ
jgi:hypothetical protein